MSTQAQIQHPRRLALMAAFQPSAVRRFAIQTIVPQFDPRAYPLPAMDALPRRCCFNAYRCGNQVRWRIDGHYFCRVHSNQLWESGESVHDHRITRL